MAQERFRKKLMEEGRRIKWGDTPQTARLTRLGKSESDRPTPTPLLSSSPSPLATTTSHSSSTSTNDTGAECISNISDAFENIDYGTTRVTGDRRDSDTGNLTGEAQEDHIPAQSDLTHLEGSRTSSGLEFPTTMPSTKGWDGCETLLSYNRKFIPVRRVKANSAELSEIIRDYEKNGIPLVIEGFHELPSWPKEMFTLENFMENTKSKEIDVRNIHSWQDSKMQLHEFVERCRSTGPYVTEDEQERFYGKDLECPKIWEEWLQKGNVVPPALLGNGPEDMFRYLTGSKAVETLMCYLGIGDTFTPCHKDLCASSGQNLMCYTENDGSSFWFMTESDAAPDAAKYFQRLGHELDHENHVLTIKQFSRTPFKVYVLQQKLGDLVLVPPRSCHQVHNAGGITVKTSWSRMTCRGLSTAYFHELPIYRRLCRKETYRVKNMVFYSLSSQAQELQALFPGTSTISTTGLPSKARRRQTDDSSNATFDEAKGRTLSDSLTQLLSIYDCILAEEYDRTHNKLRNEQNGTSDEIPYTCDFCGGDIFQSFFECRQCIFKLERNPTSDAIHICPGCYAEGRSCECSVPMRPMQYRNFSQLKDVRSDAEQAVTRFERRYNDAFKFKPLDLEDETVPSLFRAALQLRQIQTASKQRLKVCIPSSKKPSHKAISHWVLSCKGCHSGSCFAHILAKSNIHSAEALLAFGSDSSKDHSSFHQYHLAGRNKFESAMDDLKKRQQKGERHPGYGQLVFNALLFNKCLPFRKGLHAGWYDEESSGEEEEGKDDKSLSEPTPLKSLTPPIHNNIEHNLQTTPHVDAVLPIQPPKSLKRKRLIMDYVAVPPAPYPVTNVRLKRTISSDPHNLTATQTGQNDATDADHEFTPPTNQFPDSVTDIPVTSKSKDRRVSFLDTRTERRKLAHLHFKKNPLVSSQSTHSTENGNQCPAPTPEASQERNPPTSPPPHSQESRGHSDQPMEEIPVPHATPPGPSQSHQDPSTRTSPTSDVVTKSNLGEVMKTAFQDNIKEVVSTIMVQMGTTLTQAAVNSLQNGQSPAPFPLPTPPPNLTFAAGQNNPSPLNVAPLYHPHGFTSPMHLNGQTMYYSRPHYVTRGRNRGSYHPRYQQHQDSRHYPYPHTNGGNPNNRHQAHRQRPQHSSQPGQHAPHPTSGSSYGRGFDSPRQGDTPVDPIEEHIRSVEQRSQGHERRPVPAWSSGTSMDSQTRKNQQGGHFASGSIPPQQAPDNSASAAMRNSGENRVNSKNKSSPGKNAHSSRPVRDSPRKTRSSTSDNQGRRDATRNRSQSNATSNNSSVQDNSYLVLGHRPPRNRVERSEATTQTDDLMDMDVRGELDPDLAMDVDTRVVDNFDRRGATPMDDLPIVEPGATFPGDKAIPAITPLTATLVDGTSKEQDWELEYASDGPGSSPIPSSNLGRASSNQHRSVSEMNSDSTLNGFSTIIPPSNSATAEHSNQQDEHRTSVVGSDKPKDSSTDGPPLRLARQHLREDDMESIISLGDDL